ncbi:hypothetical protein halTADL_1440 [Halohasta litchfieldiae]|jgi:hypothetical protein|uniref:Restriction endonuclease n=1 Tax=Halohasta litchfieldiae TaxID=1073996 RepID=A0A1H6XTI7_9EURY|nr:hypothetical protein [Halohasta litchfieldiae]ATW88210.1 hypothetical protein halTADL_1440 [Halohasta litchfieldiae]SEJ32398.1 hypothetical protein SAMN05444271_14714 [Halohasta litchfieldiae]
MQLSRKQQGGLLAGGGLVGAAVVSWLTSDSEPKHDELLEQTYNAVDDATDDSVAIGAEHGVGDGEGTRDIDGINGWPDMAVTGFGVSSLLVEVESSDALAEKPEKVIEQVDGFQKNGYRRVIVVHSSLVDAAEELVDEINGKVHVKTPKRVIDLL